MRYRKLGKTGLEVSEIAFGTGDTGGALIHGTTRQQQDAVVAALERGVTVFDTSPDYGKGVAEVNLGRVLRDVGAPEALVMTKVEIMPENVDVHLDNIAQRVRSSIDDSLTRLRRDHVDVIMLHNPCRWQRNLSVHLPWTPLTPADVLGEVLPALQRARDAGKVRFVGAACERADIGAVKEILDSAQLDVILLWFNLANPSAALPRPVPGLSPEEDYTGLLDMAAEAGVGVGAIRPLAGGALTSAMIERGPAGRHELSRGIFTWRPEVFEPERLRGRRFAFLDRPGELTIAQAAYRYVLAHQQVSTVIGGFSSAEQLEDAVIASDAGPLPSEDAAAIDRIIAEGFTDPREVSVDWYGPE